jgi:hypothetical protein
MTANNAFQFLELPRRDPETLGVAQRSRQWVEIYARLGEPDAATPIASGNARYTTTSLTG